MDHDAIESHDRTEWQNAIKGSEREDDEDSFKQESDKLDKAIENSKAPGTMDMENPCGKPHNNGDDETQCGECMAIKLNI